MKLIPFTGNSTRGKKWLILTRISNENLYFLKIMRANWWLFINNSCWKILPTFPVNIPPWYRLERLYAVKGYWCCRKHATFWRPHVLRQELLLSYYWWRIVSIILNWLMYNVFHMLMIYSFGFHFLILVLFSHGLLFDTKLTAQSWFTIWWHGAM